MDYAAQKQIAYTTEPNQTAVLIFTSWIREVDRALAGLDLVCLTSKNEGTPVSLIEAQAASKYIITTNVGGVKDILHPDCGMLSDADDAETYKKNLLAAVDNFEQLDKQAEVASQVVLKKFSYQRLCKDMTELYGNLLKKPQHERAQ
jgi:glycosyltransferase involved in cell wall biosynthesis